MSRLIPSPDWFVGLDSIELCRGGDWLPSVAFDLGPMDAGTDQGLTFTSPNWAEPAPRPVSRLTSSHPAHPASSFRYSGPLPTLVRVVLREIAGEEEGSGEGDEEELLVAGTEPRTERGRVAFDSVAGPGCVQVTNTRERDCSSTSLSVLGFA